MSQQKKSEKSKSKEKSLETLRKREETSLSKIDTISDKEIKEIETALIKSLKGHKGSAKDVRDILVKEYNKEILSVEKNKKGGGYKITLSNGEKISSHNYHYGSAEVTFEPDLAKAIYRIKFEYKKTNKI